MKLVWALTAVMFAIGAVGYWVYRSSPEAVPCEVERLQAALSPDGQSLAEALTERCGTSLTTHVTLRRASAPEPARADVYIASGAQQVSIAWVSDALEITSPVAPLVQESSWHNHPIRIHH